MSVAPTCQHGRPERGVFCPECNIALKSARAQKSAEETNLDALLRPRPAGMRPLSAGVILFSRKLNLRILTDTEARKNLTPDEIELELYAIAWLMSHCPTDAWAATARGWEHFRETSLLPWIFDLPAAQIAPIFEEITLSLTETGAAAVEPVAKTSPAGASPEDSPPPNTSSPSG